MPDFEEGNSAAATESTTPSPELVSMLTAMKGINDSASSAQNADSSDSEEGDASQRDSESTDTEDSTSETKEETEDTAESEADDKSKESSTDDSDPFQGMNAEERAALIEMVKEWKDSQSKQGKESEASVQPTDEQKAEAERLAQQQQQQKEQEFTPYEPIKEEELMNPEDFNKYIDRRDARLVGELSKNMVQNMAVPLGVMIDTAIAAAFAERDNPHLREHSEQLGVIAGRLRMQNPNKSNGEIAEMACAELGKELLRANALKKFNTRSDARTGTPPKGKATTQRQSPTRSPGADSGNANPLADLLFKMHQINSQQ